MVVTRQWEGRRPILLAVAVRRDRVRKFRIHRTLPLRPAPAILDTVLDILGRALKEYRCRARKNLTLEHNLRSQAPHYTLGLARIFPISPSPFRPVSSFALCLP